MAEYTTAIPPSPICCSILYSPTIIPASSSRDVGTGSGAAPDCPDGLGGLNEIIGGSVLMTGTDPEAELTRGIPVGTVGANCEDGFSLPGAGESAVPSPGHTLVSFGQDFPHEPQTGIRDHYTRAGDLFA